MESNDENVVQLIDSDTDVAKDDDGKEPVNEFIQTTDGSHMQIGTVMSLQNEELDFYADDDDGEQPIYDDDELMDELVIAGGNESVEINDEHEEEEEEEVEDEHEENEEEISEEEEDDINISADKTVVIDDDDDDEDEDDENDYPVQNKKLAKKSESQDDDEDSDNSGTDDSIGSAEAIHDDEEDDEDDVVPVIKPTKKLHSQKPGPASEKAKKKQKIRFSFRARLKIRSLKCLSRKPCLNDNEPDSIDLKESTTSKSSLQHIEARRSSTIVSETVVVASPKSTANIEKPTKEIITDEPIDLDDSDNITEQEPDPVIKIEQKDNTTIISDSPVVNESKPPSVPPPPPSSVKLNGNTSQNDEPLSPKTDNECKKEEPKIEPIQISETQKEESKTDDLMPSKIIKKEIPVNQTNGVTNNDANSSIEKMIVDDNIIENVIEVPVPTKLNSANDLQTTNDDTLTAETNEKPSTINRKRPLSPSPPQPTESSSATASAAKEIPQTAPCDQSSTQENDTMPPSKRLRMELEKNFGAHDKLLRNYIEKTSNNNLDEIQQHVDELLTDIYQLNELSKIKEAEWSSILHTIKIKEEIVVRLKRKKNVMEIMSKKVGEVNDYSILDQQPSSLSKKITKEIPNSMLMNSATTMLMNSVSMVPLLSSTPATQILQNRTNMSDIELNKEKGTAARIQSMLFSRNILPKPAHTNFSNTSLAPPSSSSSSSTAAAGGGGNANIYPDQQQNQLKSLQNATINEIQNRYQQTQQQAVAAAAAAAAAIGRQGATKDVKSIIDDYRQKHPEPMPRRGRRFKSTVNGNDGAVSSSRTNDTAARQTAVENRMTELGLLLTKYEATSRPSSGDSSHSNHNVPTTTGNCDVASVSFKNALMQFAKMTQSTERGNTSAAVPTNMANMLSNAQVVGNSSMPLNHISGRAGIGTGLPLVGNSSSGYPEVTLHPVQAQIAEQQQQSQQQQNQSAASGSLLHEILSKNTRPSSSGFTSFSPTLARLLTAPERITTPHTNNYHHHLQAHQQQQHSQLTQHQQQQILAATGINLATTPKPQSEITITPVVQSSSMAAAAAAQTILQQQLQKQHDTKMKQEYFMNMDDEADDSADRLVIDESDANENATNEQVRSTNRSFKGQEFYADAVPECQGCKKREAQFVCAACGNQWYCSRECQVNAWDEHSDVCTG